MIRSKNSRLLAQGKHTREGRIIACEQSPEFQQLVKVVELRSLRAARNNEARMQSAVVPTIAENAPLASIDFFRLARGEVRS